MIYIDEYNSPLFTFKPTINLVGFFISLIINNLINQIIFNDNYFKNKCNFIIIFKDNYYI